MKFNYVNFNPSQVSRSVPIKGLADFIKEILVLGLEKETEIVYGQSKTYGRKNAIKIKPAVDDRMFVVSMVLNGNLIKKAWICIFGGSRGFSSDICIVRCGSR